MMVRIILLFLLPSLFSSAFASSSIDVVPPDYMPPPWQDTASLCRPRHASRAVSETDAVCDPSALLSRRKMSHLNSMLADIYAGIYPYSLVSCDQSSYSDFQHGFRVAVALVRRMSFDSLALSSRAERFANTLFENWNMDQDCGASVLLFLSLEDRRIYIRTGLLAVEYLNEHQIDDVYAKIIPQLSKGRISTALETGVATIGSYLAKYRGKPGGVRNGDARNGDARNGDARNTVQKPKGASVPLFFRYGPEWWDLELSIVVAIVAVLILIACCNGVGGPEAARKRRERRHVLRKLDILRTEYVSAMLPQYVPSTCPYCQDDLSAPWAPTVPTLASTGDRLHSANEDVEDIRAKPVRTLRCGHSFHETCFDDENPGLGGFIQECPVCKYRVGDTSAPPSLSETRQQDLSFRLHRLREEYPHILTEEVIAKLESEPPNTWPDTMTESYLRRIARRRRRGRGVSDESGSDGWGGCGWWGPIGWLTAGGLGAMMASSFAGWRRRSGGGYSDIPSENGGGHVGQWGAFNGGVSGGGHGSGWGNALSNVTGGGLGRGWGFGGGGHGAGWGGGGGGGGHGTGWGGGGGGGGGSGGGHGTGW